jgi:hypothetical protein
MYRQRIHQQILYGRFREYMAIAREVVAFRQELGLAPARLWVPTFGTANEIVWEFEYADLATFQSDNTTFYAHEGAMKKWRELWQQTAQGSIRDELLEEAPEIA